VREDKVLLVKHADAGKPDYGVWLLPAGSVKLGESFEEALKREINEETGLSIKIVRKLTEHIDPYTKKKLVNFLCTPLTSSVEISSELSEAKWFDLKEITMLENIHPDLKKFLTDGLRTAFKEI
jgi:8-oxo-dGTP pyrophosphatase MutT (NUDIX family)